MIHIRLAGDDHHRRVEVLGVAGEILAATPTPLLCAFWSGRPSDWQGTSVASGYTTTEVVEGGLLGRARVEHDGATLIVTDRWSTEAGGLRLDRHARCIAAAQGAAVRLALDLPIVAEGFSSRSQVFAPPAVYDLNDIDQDGVEDYLDTRELVFRDDRLTGLTVMAYEPARRLGVALSRHDLPEHDDVPERARGQQAFAQATDIGSLGLVPGDAGWQLAASYPFVERARSHALTAQAREPWGAFLPVAPGTELSVSYQVDAVDGATATDALWALWRRRAAHLSPSRVELTVPVTDLTALRLDAMMPYFRQDGTTAGFVTNCHPQDGRQLGDVLQYGFTGQSVLNAMHVLRHASEITDPQARDKALAAVDGFVAHAADSPAGLVRTLYDFDSGRRASWWSGLLLPLAYAEEGADLDELMGPVLDHMRYAIDALSAAPDGTYLRCVAEEHHALLRAYRLEAERGHAHPDWLEVATRFGAFLLGAQEPDGSWRRAYAFDGSALIEPRAWFGRSELNQKSSTATAVPFLAELYRVTGEARWADAALRAARFVAEHFVRDLKFNGGIHDSIYARAQLVDSESILFSLRACLVGQELAADDDFAAASVAAARVLATWVYLWDVPLPPTSTMAGYGFRSTGWSACDTAGAGYIHPYELHAVPDLFDAALLGRDELLAQVADLVLHGSNETVATDVCNWGYARIGLQEEGLLVSWWLIDDPMFLETGFGGRGKGEGNKTCLPWISAVGIDATDVVMDRWGSTDLTATWRAASGMGVN